MQIIRTNALTKHFGTTTATDSISIQVDQGEIYGFLGLNGAGKTTLIRILSGMIKPDKGRVMLFGKRLTSGFDQWKIVIMSLYSGWQYWQDFDIYDLSSNTWSIGVLPQSLSGHASVISANNVMYVAGGISCYNGNCENLTQVWKLQF